MKKPSVILLGSKPGSVAALTILIERGWDINCVVVDPKNEHCWLPMPSIEEYAQSRNLNIFQSQQEIPDETKVDFVISYMCRNLVKHRTLKMASRAALNFHAGPLPEFGGWAFYNIAILDKAKEYGCTCHYMDEDFDTGPLLKVAKFSIDHAKETALSLEGKAQVKMIKLFVEFCEMAESKERLPLTPQEANKMRYMKRDEFEKLKEIPSNASSEEIDRRARAFWYPPYACAHMMINGKRVEIVPDIAKEQMAKNIHSADLKKLLDAVGSHLL